MTSTNAEESTVGPGSLAAVADVENKGLAVQSQGRRKRLAEAPRSLVLSGLCLPRMDPLLAG